jgi:predicted kinase
MTAPLLVVLAGRPGTGKTTLAAALAPLLQAVPIRVDAIETAILRTTALTAPVGPVGYAIAHDLAAAVLAAGVPVIVDAVNPVPEARAGWIDLADRTGSRLVVLETVLTDPVLHEQRVRDRRPDLPGQRVPTWEEVRAGGYVPWDELRDGPRHVLDTADGTAALASARAVLQV